MASIAAKESITGTIVTYIGVGIGFLTTFFILAKFLTPEEIGLTRLLPELATQLSGLGMLGMTYSLSRYFPFFRDSETNPHRPEDGPNHGFLYYVTVVGIIGAAVMILLYVLAEGPLMALYSKNSPLLGDFYYAVIPLTLFTMGWTIFELYTYQLMRVAVPKGIKEVLLRVLQLAVYLLYAFGYIDFTTMVWGFIGSFGVCMLASGAYLGRITPPKSEAQPPLRLCRDASRLLPLYRPLHADLGRYYPLGTYGPLYGRLPRPRGTLFGWGLYNGLLYGLDHRDTDACHPQCGCT